MLIFAFLIGAFEQSPGVATTGATKVVVEARAEDDGVHVHMEGMVEAPVEIVADVVGDVERYPCWLPIIGSVRVTQTFALAPVFDTEWRLPWPLGTLRQRMRFERMPTDSGVLFFFEQRNGEMKRHSGYWVLAKTGQKTHVIYDASIAFRTWVPRFLLASFERAELPKLLTKLEGEARRRGNVASVATRNAVCIGNT
jgi:hypothetical protein